MVTHSHSTALWQSFPWCKQLRLPARTIPSLLLWVLILGVLIPQERGKVPLCQWKSWCGLLLAGLVSWIRPPVLKVQGQVPLLPMETYGPRKRLDPLLLGGNGRITFPMDTLRHVVPLLFSLGTWSFPKKLEAHPQYIPFAGIFPSHSLGTFWSPFRLQKKREVRLSVCWTSFDYVNCILFYFVSMRF